MNWEEWHNQKIERERKEAEWKKLQEEENFVNAWILKEQQQAEESNLLCPRCHQGVPGHKGAYYCPQCMAAQQRLIDYKYVGSKVFYWTYKDNKMHDV